MPMRAVFITLTQASRAPGSVTTMRRTVSRRRSSRSPEAWSTSTAAITMGLLMTWLATPSSGAVCGSAPIAKNQRFKRCSVPLTWARCARAVSGTCVGSCSARASCAPLCQRFAGFTSRHFRITSCSQGGQSARSARGGIGSTYSRRRRPRTVTGEPKGRWPVVKWYSITPSANRSERGSSRTYCTCSGDMYGPVPIGSENSSSSRSGRRSWCDSPKSIITAVPSGRKTMLLGFTSRCTRCWRCSSCSAVATREPISMTSSIASGASSSRARSDGPSMRSITM